MDRSHLANATGVTLATLSGTERSGSCQEHLIYLILEKCKRVQEVQIFHDFHLIFALLPAGLKNVKIVRIRVKVINGIQLFEALREDIHLLQLALKHSQNRCSTWVKAMIRGRYSWRALSKASLASSASFCALVAATTEALASVMLPWGANTQD